MSFPYEPEPDPRCFQCGDDVNWIDDPSPDLCHVCRLAGLYSPLWTPDRVEKGHEMLDRILKERRKGNEEQ